MTYSGTRSKHLLKLWLLVIAMLMGCRGEIQASTELDSLLAVLDEAIAKSPEAEQAVQRKIVRHRINLAKSRDNVKRFGEANTLFFTYKHLNMDSALYYARLRVEIASEMHNRDSLALALMTEADGLKGLGRFSEALSILNSIVRSDFVTSSSYYYHLYHSVMLSLSAMASGDAEQQQFKQKLECYRDTIGRVNPSNSVGYAINRGEQLRHRGDYRGAVTLLENYRRNHADEVEQNATFWSVLACNYEQLGDMDRSMECFARGAIIDKRNCNKTYTTLQNLAMRLYENGDVERAYRYISHSMEDVVNCNARSRLTLVAEYMPIISDAYKRKQMDDRRHTMLFFLVLGVNLLLLLLFVAVLIRRNKKLTELRALIEDQNKELTQMNGDLNALNQQLLESNKIKEKYIGQLFNLCSSYIDNIDRIRLSYLKKVNSGNLSGLRTALSKSATNDNIKTLYHHFDAVFVELFPNFVESFNNLLRPDEQIEIKDGELLSSEMRIYALVRLGIGDSIKIASMLHYSPQTVYNYRLKVRNKARVPKNNFESMVKSL